MQKTVDIQSLKNDIVAPMSTGYKADDILCGQILEAIDQNTVKVEPERFHPPEYLSQALNEGDGRGALHSYCAKKSPVRVLKLARD